MGTANSVGVDALDQYGVPPDDWYVTYTTGAGGIDDGYLTGWWQPANFDQATVGNWLEVYFEVDLAGLPIGATVTDIATSVNRYLVLGDEFSYPDDVAYDYLASILYDNGSGEVSGTFSADPIPTSGSASLDWHGAPVGGIAASVFHANNTIRVLYQCRVPDGNGSPSTGVSVDRVSPPVLTYTTPAGATMQVVCVRSR